jgi:predicted porin
VTNVEGDPLARDFEKYTYRGSSALRWEPIERHAVRLSYGGKVRDYVETTGLDSLDWYSHGPELDWSFDLRDDLELEAGYEITFQNYEEEPAADRTGDDNVAGYPDEEHFFHRVDAGLEWEALPDLELSAGYLFRAKDDRFRDYESYEDHGAELGIDWRPVPPITLSLESRYSHRDYRHREDDGGSELEYDRVEVDFGARYDLSKHLALFGGYGFNYRDTNRRDGTSYRDYTIHTVLGGVALAY